MSMNLLRWLTGFRLAPAPAPRTSRAAGDSRPVPAEPACCCPAQATYRVVIPPSQARPHRTELLLCGHHYRASRTALTAASAVGYELVLIPVILVAIVGPHVLLVRMRGVSHPLPAVRPRSLAARRAAARADREAWRGPTRRYDLLKEGTIASAVILALTFGLAGMLSSPDVPSVTVKSWAQAAPADFLATADSELAGSSLSAGYGPPYNTAGSPQKIGFSPANWFGVTYPIDTAQTYVLGPLAAAPTEPSACGRRPFGAGMADSPSSRGCPGKTWAGRVIYRPPSRSRSAWV